MYGITIEDYNRMLVVQEGKCATCLRSFGDQKGRKACVDHNHVTGKVRGLLCFNCNTVLGKVYDETKTLARMIEYLSKKDSSDG